MRQANVLYLLPMWLGALTSHPVIKTHPDRSRLALVVYGTPNAPFKYKRRTRSAGFRDVIYGNNLYFDRECQPTKPHTRTNAHTYIILKTK